MKRSSFSKPTYQEALEKKKKAQQRARLRAAEKPKTPRRALKTKNTTRTTKKTKTRTKRAKKMDAKKKLCEQYNLPSIPCSRWGTAKTFTRQDLLKGMLWHVFSKYIRERDKDLSCITCNIKQDVYQAGHYVPVGGNNLELCFNETNVNGECPTCNGDFQGWHLVPMRKNLIRKYGEEAIEELDRFAGMKTTVKWNEEEFVTRIRKYL